MATESTTTTATKTTWTAAAFATTTTAFAALWRLWLKTFYDGHRNTLIRQRFDGTHFHAITMFGKRNGFTRTTGTASTTNTVYVVFRLHWQTKVEYVGNAWHVDTAGSNVGSHQHANVAATQLLQAMRTNFLRHSAV